MYKQKLDRKEKTMKAVRASEPLMIAFFDEAAGWVEEEYYPEEQEELE